jgi:hypothetical protein
METGVDDCIALLSPTENGKALVREADYTSMWKVHPLEISEHYGVFRY